eukprot:12684197-Alexandrium_andersonii.AAC.1
MAESRPRTYWALARLSAYVPEARYVVAYSTFQRVVPDTAPSHLALLVKNAVSSQAYEGYPKF